ncbi:hypothetical protein B0H19DRAFT_1258659 [Mycena capillaripes]|nr:hypothetical protein B0H19DRAFT_1258659 [Mycena capillaripes]
MSLIYSWAGTRLKRPSRKELGDLLPFELWDLVLEDLTDNDLLQTACVCRGLNHLSLAIYLRRHNITRETTSLNIPSYFLRVLHISCVTSHIHTLQCKFQTFDLLRHMRSLRELVAKWPDLTEMSLNWSGHNLFAAHRYDNRVPYPPDALIDILREVFLAVVDRTGGPVMVVGNGTLNKFRRDDISGWHLCNAGRRRGTSSIIARVRSTLRNNTMNSHIAVQLHGPNGKILHLNHIEAVNVRSIRITSRRLGRFTLIAFSSTYLVLQPTSVFSAEDISIILPHIAIPSLERLDLRTHAIDPVALSQFVRNHLNIVHIQWSRSGLNDNQVMAPVVLCDPPAGLPHLTRLHANDGFALAGLLDAFASPEMCIIALQINRSTPFHVAGVKAGLRRLSLQTHDQPITLEINTSPTSWGVRVQVDDDERFIVSTLYCVKRVCLMDANFKAAKSMLSWLAMLPALRQLELRLDRSVRLNCDKLELANFIAAAKAALPWVSVADRSSY